MRRFWTLKRECSELHDRWKGRKRPKERWRLNFISRCSKLFYTISRCSFHIETLSGASVSFVFSHIARYVPSPEENSCIPITHFQCGIFSPTYEIKICLYFWGVSGPWRGNVASYTTDERAENDQKERWRLNFISRCSKLFYTISRCSFHIENIGRICFLRFQSHSPLCSFSRRKQLHPDNALFNVCILNTYLWN